MPINGAIATVEKIAINAVMAGCRPEYMPVLLATVEAIVEPDYMLHANQLTTGGGTPFLVINGPIAKELDINAKYQVLGPGWQSNATMGRAIRMIITNCAGTWPGANDMATMATPARYSMVIAEDEEGLPPGWKPLNVQAGHDRGTNSVTALNMMGMSTCGINGTPEENLSQLSEIVEPTYNPVVWGSGAFMALVSPAYAKYLYDGGFTSKESVSAWLFEHTGRPLGALKKRGFNFKTSVDAGHMPSWVLKADDPDVLVPLLPRPEDYIIIVAGDSGGVSYGIRGYMFAQITRATDKYKPANWQELLETRKKEIGRTPIP